MQINFENRIIKFTLHVRIVELYQNLIIETNLLYMYTVEFNCH